MIWDTLHWNPMKHKYTIKILNRNNEQINKQTNKQTTVFGTIKRY